MNCKTESGHKQSAGFTLIELVVAILVFALGIMGIMKMHSASVQSNNYSMALTEAVSIAEDEMEYLRGQKFTSADMNTGTHTLTYNNTVTRGTLYNVTYTVTDPLYSMPTRDIALTVTWQEKSLTHKLNMNARWDQLDTGE